MISVICLLIVPKVPSELTSHSVMSKTESLAPSIFRLTVLERFLGKPFLAVPFLPIDWNRCVHVCVLSRFNRVWLCDPMNRSPQGFSVHGILQAKILEWVCHALPQGISRPGDQAHVSMSPALADGFFTLVLPFPQHPQLNNVLFLLTCLVESTHPLCVGTWFLALPLKNCMACAFGTYM